MNTIDIVESEIRRLAHLNHGRIGIDPAYTVISRRIQDRKEIEKMITSDHLTDT